MQQRGILFGIFALLAEAGAIEMDLPMRQQKCVSEFLRVGEQGLVEYSMDTVEKEKPTYVTVQVIRPPDENGHKNMIYDKTDAHDGRYVMAIILLLFPGRLSVIEVKKSCLIYYPLDFQPSIL